MKAYNSHVKTLSSIRKILPKFAPRLITISTKTAYINQEKTQNSHFLPCFSYTTLLHLTHNNTILLLGANFSNTSMTWCEK